MIGYEPDEIEPTADWWREQLHPEDREASFRMLEKCVRAERTEYRLEYRMKAKSGHWRWLLSLGKVVGYDAQGQPLRMLGTHMDITERKQTEEELERAHTLLEAILDQSPVPMVVASAPDHVVRYGNRAAAELLGVSDEPSYAGLTLAEIQRRQTWHDLHPDGTPIGFLEMPLARAMRCETTRNEEYIVARKDGTQRWELVSGTPVYSSTGDLLAGLVVFPDITERKRAEEALRESEAFRKRVFESSQIPIIVMDAATFKYIDCNPAAVEIYRFASCEETLGKTPLDVSAPVQYDGTPSPEKVRFYIAKAQAEGTVVFEWRHQRPNGEVWDAEVHLMSFQSGPRKLFQFTLQEITERKRTEEELKSSEAILRSVFRATPVGITFNIDRVIIDVNDSMCELTGYREQELIGQDVRMCYVTQQEYEEAGREMYPKISQKGRVSVETRFRRKDGTIIYVFLTAAMLRVEDPSAGFVVTVQDITERKRAEAELTQHRDRLEELVRERTAELEKEIAERKQTEQRIQAALVEKELLLREVHHRVKNNLNTIANMLYFQTKTVEDKKALAAFQDSQHRIQSMARVHEHLYRAASLARVNMASYFEDLTVDLQQTCGTNTVSIRIDAAKEHLDIDQAIPCGLIVNELVTNSLKYAFPESPTNQRNEVTVQLTTQAEQHILEVRDNGVGLPAGMDVENSSSLGLRLVSMLTRQLKGRLTVDTAPGKGTRFTIAFPLEMKGIT
jgi:PAS domain S-box-containing protein